MPEPVRALETEKIAEGRYCISDGITRCYLFVGAEKALLLDSGFGEFPIGEAVGAITDLPLLLRIPIPMRITAWGTISSPARRSISRRRAWGESGAER